jgi:predicted dehydrogenase
MYQAADMAGVVHMTAFTCRFVPALRYIKSLVDSNQLGSIRHFRSQRFMQLPETSWQWRQYQDRSGAGNLYDSLLPRIDLGLWMVGSLREVCGTLTQFARRDQTSDGRQCSASDVDDWSCLIGRFSNGATGNWEGSHVAKGHHHEGFGHESLEINGSLGTAAYQLNRPHSFWLGTNGRDVSYNAVPEEFLVHKGSQRNPDEGSPLTSYRYDQASEFITAIIEKRSAFPSFHAGWAAQRIADAVRQSHQVRGWVCLAEQDGLPTAVT